MLPVRLSLRNFLSYGEDAPELDFEAFHVACLSGGNGQGKSAILDAITWALWGEARKAGGKPKPDDEILRVGAREMEVVFTFDLGAQRYRVLRRYARTAGGTGKPTLEFQVYDADADAFEPLTAPTLSATQARITERLGLDHETFVNSTFLLQGRSDEFTRKSAGDRKKILGKILGLGRYEALEERARARQAEAKEDAARLTATEERLRADLADEPRWRAEHAEAEQAVAALAAEREALEAEERRLTKALAHLDAAQREADAHRKALADLAARRDRGEQEAQALAARLADAEALIARADEIEAAHARYERAAAERRDLEGIRALHDGLQHQVRTLTAQRDERRRDAERRIERAAAELEQHRRRLAEWQRDLCARPRLEADLRAAEAAEAERARLARIRQERVQAQGRLDKIEQRLAAARGALTGRLASIEKQLAAPLPDADALRARLGTLSQRVEALEAEAAALESVRAEGLAQAEAVARLEAEHEALGAERAALEARRERLRATGDGPCPTCGAALDDAHRRKVEAEYRAEAGRLARASEAHAQKLRDATARRAALREAFRRHQEVVRPLPALRDERARLAEQLARLDDERAARAAARADADGLRRQLDANAFEPELHAQATALRDRLEELPFDEAAFEEVMRRAAAAARIRQDLAALAEKAGMANDLATLAARDEKALDALRADLDAGAPFADVQARLADAERQRDALGYDAARHEAVAAEAERLAGAPAALGRLLDARRHALDWAARRDALAREDAALAAEAQQHTEALGAFAERLAERDALRAAHAEAQRTRAAHGARLQAAQQALGALAERLERCARDRTRLAETAAALKEARRRQTLYTKLRTAFGRSGIPALIIEETVPEIEARANELLGRLSGGRTRVALETLRDKKSGGTRETLDIRITDETGQPRAYELFSGGEAFRVNFALRIALSQMLAERAGTRIRTLVVDEGFGTQDREGIQQLIGAIRSIQDDFDKILVITHLDELKDAFPVRIEVTKRPVAGSTFELVGA